MGRVVSYPLESGGSVFIEVDDRPQQTMRGGRGDTDTVDKAVGTFDGAVEAIRPAVATLASRFRGMADAPETVTVQFGLKFTAAAGAFIASVGTEAQFQVTMTWKR